MSAALDQIAELVHRQSGVRIPSAGRSATIGRARATATPNLDAAAFLQRVAGDGDSLARLIDEVTVKETFFCRDEQQLRTIDWRALAERALARGSDAVEVWTAGCATGEEPYTLALLALETFGTPEPPVRILGTDISRTALDLAEQGRYRERSVRLLPWWQRALHFDHAPDGSTRIGEHPRGLVRFAHHNLVRDAVPAPGAGCFDLVLCRNVLIYFDAPTVVTVLDRLHQALRPDGVLILGSSDALCLTAVALAELERRTKAGTPARAARRPKLRKRTRTVAVPRTDDGAADGQSHFLHGLVALERGDAGAAVAALRRALYLEPDLAVAAFQLGRAHEAGGDGPAAVRAYEQTLRTLAEHPQSDTLLEQIDPADVAAACRHRLEALT